MGARIPRPHVAELRGLAEPRVAAGEGVEHPLDRPRAVAEDPELADHRPLLAEATAVVAGAGDRHALIVAGLGLDSAAERLDPTDVLEAVAVDLGVEEGRLADLEDQGEIGALADVGIAADDRDLADGDGAEDLRQLAADDPELGLVALRQPPVLRVLLEELDERGDPTVGLTKEPEEERQRVKAGVPEVCGGGRGQRLRRASLGIGQLGLHRREGVLGQGRA